MRHAQLTAPDTRLVPARIAGLLACIAAALPVLVPTVRGDGDWTTWSALACFGVFALAFWRVTDDDAEPRRQVSWMAAQVVATVGAAWTTGSTLPLILCVIVATELPWFLGVAMARTAALVLLATCALPLWAGSSPTGWVVTVVVFAGFQVFGLETALLSRREERARRELYARNAELVSTRALVEQDARRAERHRLAADLHDVLGHDLVALSVALEAARRTEGTEARDHLDRAHEVVGTLLDDLRALVRLERSRAPFDLGAALRRLAEGLPQGLLHVEHPGDLPVPDLEVAELLLRAAQETVANAVRHGEADRVTVSVRREGARVVLTTEDDGEGRIGDAVETADGGLARLRERVVALGGHLRVEDRLPQGHRVSVGVPVRGSES